MRVLKKGIWKHVIATVLSVLTVGLGTWLIVVPMREKIASALPSPELGVVAGIGLIAMGTILFAYTKLKK